MTTCGLKLTVLLCTVIWKIFVGSQIHENLSHEIILTRIISYKINVELRKLNN